MCYPDKIPNPVALKGNSSQFNSLEVKDEILEGGSGAFYEKHAKHHVFPILNHKPTSSDLIQRIQSGHSTSF